MALGNLRLQDDYVARVRTAPFHSKNLLGPNIKELQRCKDLHHATTAFPSQRPDYALQSSQEASTEGSWDFQVIGRPEVGASSQPRRKAVLSEWPAEPTEPELLQPHLNGDCSVCQSSNPSPRVHGQYP